LLLQAAMLAVVWRLLYPPTSPPPQSLLVLSADHELGGSTPRALDEALQSLPPAQRAELAQAGRVIALPEAGVLPASLEGIATPAPDLAAALRSTPAARLIVLGAGLPARDRDVARELPLLHLPAAPAQGIVEIHSPTQAQPGAWWSLHGLVQPPSEGWQLRLSDPAGAELARLAPAADGRFELSARTPISGRHLYRLELRDGNEQVLEAISVPIRIDAPPALRLALYTAAPNPESKYLRRWALDAGLALDSRQALRPGMALTSGAATSARNSAADWAQTDLLIIEDRVWRNWRANERAAVRAAVEAGMGLLLRLTETPDANASALFAELGFSVASAELPLSVRLPSRPGSGSCDPASPPTTDTAPAGNGPGSASTEPAGCAGAATLTLNRRPVTVSAAQATALLQAADGSPLGLWRPIADGRVGLLWLSDSYRLALASEAADHADRWSAWVATLARARGAAAEPMAAVPPLLWAGERASLCGAWRSVVDPSGAATPLLPDPQADHCRGWWPRIAGWHRLTGAIDAPASASSPAGTDPDRWVYVRAADDGRALRWQQTQDWMTAHSAPGQMGADGIPQAIDGNDRASDASLSLAALPTSSRWFWWSLFWLLVSALWWIERPSAAQRRK
jgi:hypothetical protein